MSSANRKPQARSSAVAMDVEKALHDSLLEYFGNPKPGIISPWFRNRGSVFHFVFRKNLRVTNIQYSELISLIRQHARRDDVHIGNEILFFRVNDFITTFHGIIELFKSDDVGAAATALTAQYLGLMRNSVIVDSLFGSCCVFLPPGMTIPLDQVVAHSGYIAFAGRNVYTRNVLKATKAEFLDSLKSYVRKHPVPGQMKRLFAVYAHEDFTETDRELHADLANGLDELKIYVEKNYMKNDSLVDVIRGIGRDSDLTQHLLIPGAGDSSKTHPKMRGLPECHVDSTFWLMSDRSINPVAPQNPGNERYYFCFEQLFINRNQFYLFDENKPAWKASTTIPHTLVAAMLNIGVTARRVAQSRFDVVDPFSGTGTTLFESIKYSDCRISTADIDPLTAILIRDNADFFSKNQKQINDLKEALIDGKEGNLGKLFNVYMKCAKLFENIKGGEMSASPEDVSLLEAMSYSDRFRFYFLLRTHINATASIATQRQEFDAAYRSEVMKFVKTIDRYLVLLDRVNQSGRRRTKKNKFLYFVDKYSVGMMIDPKAIADARSRLKQPLFKHHIRGVEDLPEDQYDLIVTDPPYGFNATTDIGDLAKLYDTAILRLLKSTKSDAQILLALPDRSYSGKTSPVFTHKEVVIQQFLTNAQNHSHNREILTNVQSIPLPAVYQPPYYWESAKALRRSIVHLRIKRRS